MAVICRWTIYKYLVILSDKHTLLDSPFSVEETRLSSFNVGNNNSRSNKRSNKNRNNNSNNSVTQYQIKISITESITTPRTIITTKRKTTKTYNNNKNRNNSNNTNTNHNNEHHQQTLTTLHNFSRKCLPWRNGGPQDQEGAEWTWVPVCSSSFLPGRVKQLDIFFCGTGKYMGVS